MQVCVPTRLFVFVSLLVLFCACTPALLAQDALAMVGLSCNRAAANDWVPLYS